MIGNCGVDESSSGLIPVVSSHEHVNRTSASIIRRKLLSISQEACVTGGQMKWIGNYCVLHLQHYVQSS